MSGNEISSQDIKIFFNASLATVRSCDATPFRCEFFRVCQADTRHLGLQIPDILDCRYPTPWTADVSGAKGGDHFEPC